MLYETLSLAPDERAPAVARHRLKHLLSHVPADVLDDLLLLSTEVLTNSLRHAGIHPQDRIHLEIRWSAESVRVAVTDPGSGEVFTPRLARPDDTGGRGLLLLAEVSDRWGIERSQATTVWFEFSLSERVCSDVG